MQPVPLKREKTIDELAFDLEVAKAELILTKNAVEDAEQALIAAVPCELEGSTTTTTAYYKIVTTGKLTRSLDEARLAQVQSVVPQKIYERVIRYKPDLSLRDLRYLESNEPEYYRAFAEAITTKPAKTSIKVDRIEPSTPKE